MRLYALYSRRSMRQLRSDELHPTGVTDCGRDAEWYAVRGFCWLLRIGAWIERHRWDIHRAMLRSGFLWLDEEGGYYKDAYLPAFVDRLQPSPSDSLFARIRAILTRAH